MLSVVLFQVWLVFLVKLLTRRLIRDICVSVIRDGEIFGATLVVDEFDDDDDILTAKNFGKFFKDERSF